MMFYHWREKKTFFSRKPLCGASIGVGDVGGDVHLTLCLK